MRTRKVTARPTARRVTKSAGTNLQIQEAPAPADDYTDLVRLAAAGDATALDRLLLKAQAVAWRFSNSVCGRADDAEDAMQEALIRTYRHVSRLRDPGSFRPWLYRTVRNACLMGRRKKSGEPARLRSLDEVLPGPNGPAFREIASPAKTPEELAANTKLRRRIRAALQRLPAPYRAIVFLREMEGLSTREVADVMGISEANVKQRLHRARLQLQAALDREAQ